MICRRIQRLKYVSVVLYEAVGHRIEAVNHRIIIAIVVKLFLDNFRFIIGPESSLFSIQNIKFVELNSLYKMNSGLRVFKMVKCSKTESNSR